ncbi:MAG TPA: RHS repeat-associated core domain-containing protein [Dehalococcoidia bacterium]|nr:RHS repeat-associated core domain-containing protein [Dehalococcoidia bacterium]
MATSIPQVLDDETLKYVYGLGRISQVGASATYYYLADGLGSTMTLVDDAGDLVNTYDYDVFGAVRASTGAQANEFKFTGEQADSSTGMEYLRARYYDMASGRFLSADPVLGLLGDPPTQNRYPYVLNGPATYIDPFGLICLKLGCAKKAIVSAAKAVAPVAGQCLIWGATGAAFGGGVVGFAAGCGAAIASYALQKSGVDNPFVECSVWGTAAVLGRNPSNAKMAAGCLAGLASTVANDLNLGGGAQCPTWGIPAAGAAGGSAVNRVLVAGTACAAGMASAWWDGLWDGSSLYPKE